MEKIIDVSEMQVSSDPGVTFVADSIGAGVVIAICDPDKNAGGVLHYMLPDSRTMKSSRAKQYPFMFADTGMEALFHAIRGCGIELQRAMIVAAGGSTFIDQQAFLNIGRLNVDAVRSILRDHQLKADMTHVGGISSRVLRLRLADGCVDIQSTGPEVILQ